jgi:hypothetical protein
MSAAHGTNPIGGYFALELGVSARTMPWSKNAVGYQSARAAIAAILLAANAKTVWVPNYVCAAVNDALEYVNVKVRRYNLAADLGVPLDVQLADSDWLICIDYFGICDGTVRNALERFGADKVLVDASQSLFYPPRENGTTIYSPRKFVGIPDGGWLISPLAVAPQQNADETASIFRSQHLLSRLGGAVGVGYQQFKQAEASLVSCAPKAMSDFTQALLASIDMVHVATRRRSNYLRMAEAFSAHNLQVAALAENDVPLCCPLLNVNADILRQHLTLQKIYTPIYWDDAAIPADDAIARCLRDYTVFLPCDQRYTDNEIGRVIHTVIEMRESLCTS